MIRDIPKFSVLLLATALAAPVSADSSLAKARREIEEARRLGWLYNGPAAHPHFENAERRFKEQGGARNAMLTRVGHLRGEWETLSFFQFSLTSKVPLLYRYCPRARCGAGPPVVIARRP